MALTPQKEISARYASPHPQPLALAVPGPALDVATPATARYTFRKIIGNMIARAEAAAERQRDALGTVEEGSSRAASGDVDIKRDMLHLQASHDMDKRMEVVQGSGEVLVGAGGEVENSILHEEVLGSSGLGIVARETKARSSSTEDLQNGKMQAYEHGQNQGQRAAEGRSQSADAEQRVANERRSINVDAEDGGLEVRGQMGGLTGE